MQTVTLQLFNQGQWWDLATLSFCEEQLSASCSLCYEPEYIAAVARYDIKDCWACTVNAPISIRDKGVLELKAAGRSSLLMEAA